MEEDLTKFAEREKPTDTVALGHEDCIMKGRGCETRSPTQGGRSTYTF
ncbi:MAG: hypothetical protein MSA13_08400 [Prevotella sp.]|nr:hypothetical protein [Prevotella sp.]